MSRDPVSHRQRRPALVLTVPQEWPSAPKEWLSSTRKEWDEFGGTDLAGLVDAASMPSLRYLFELRDRRERYLRSSRGSNALAKGSQGQEVVNPLLKQLPTLNREIRMLESQFGMTPAARARMTRGEVGKTALADILDRLDDEDDAIDPRLMVLSGGKEAAG